MTSEKVKKVPKKPRIDLKTRIYSDFGEVGAHEQLIIELGWWSLWIAFFGVFIVMLCTCP